MFEVAEVKQRMFIQCGKNGGSEIQAFIVEMYLLAYASFILVLHSVHKIVCTSQCIA